METKFSLNHFVCQGQVANQQGGFLGPPTLVFLCHFRRYQLKKGVEEIFLTYANLPLKNNPENLLKVFEVARRHVHISNNLWKHLKLTTDYICLLFDIGDVTSKDDALLKANLEFECGDSPGYDNFEIAYHSSFTFPLFDQECQWCYPLLDNSGEFRKKFWKQSGYENRKPKCYQCDQLLFIHTLLELITLKEYKSDLPPALKLIAEDMHNSIMSPVYISPASGNQAFGKLIQEKRAWITAPYTNDEGMNRSILHLVTFSLVEFLKVKKKKKIKRCVICKDFFITNYSKQITCPKPKSCQAIYKKDYHKKDMSERRDPDSDKFDPKYV